MRTSTLWKQVKSGSIGDPIVQYDHEADRWLMLEMKAFGEDAMIMAVSETPDPTGAWYVYRVPTLGFPDYPKLYVWPNAYFLTVNEIADVNRCSGYALERSAMLAGKANFKIYRFEMPNYRAINYQPATGADWEAGPPPPPGSPALIFRVYDDMWDGGQDQLQIWEVYVDWTEAAKSRIEGPTRLFPTPFETRVCLKDNLFECIEQPNNRPSITALENIVMYRAPYRNFGDHESIVLNHVTDVSGQRGDGGDAQVRWYELRRTPQSGGWYIHQEGTYAPDLETNRFMGTIAMDAAGNIGLGYSVCSETTFPGIRLAGRRAADPLGQMSSPEEVLIAGQNAHTTSRWGDYSSLAVDPVDGRTFWFTGEYQGPGSSFWNTRIASFRIISDNFDAGPSRFESPLTAAELKQENVTISILNGGTEAVEAGLSLSLYLDGNLIVTDLLPQAIPVGAKTSHLFSQKVDLSEVGKKYTLMVISKWAKDEYPLNDTLRTEIRHLIKEDAALLPAPSFSALICDKETELPVLLKNTGAGPLLEANISYRFNGGPTLNYDWTGNLAPGAATTVLLPNPDVVTGKNTLSASLLLVNGNPDPIAANNNLELEFQGLANGFPLVIKGNSRKGSLHWEIRNNKDDILHAGDINEAGDFKITLCGAADSCYNFLYYANSLRWEGDLQLLEFNEVKISLFETVSIAPEFESFCMAAKVTTDIGITNIISPVSGENLSATAPVILEIKNYGTEAATDIKLSCLLNGAPIAEELVSGPLAPGAVLRHTFNTSVDLSASGAEYFFLFQASLAQDENDKNNNAASLVRRWDRRDLSIREANMSSACGNVYETKLRFNLLNNGLDKVESFKVGYSVNGVAQQPLSYTAQINNSGIWFAPEVWVSGSVAGSNELSLYLMEFNGISGDALPQNDTLRLQYTIDPAKAPLRLTLVTDDKPGETRWEILDRNKQPVYSGGPYPFAQFPQNLNFCLLSDSCYTFNVYDSGNDGMGNIIELYHEGFKFWSYAGGNFGDTLSTAFCNRGACSGLNVVVTVLPDKPTANPDGLISLKISGGQGPYQYILNDGPPKSSPIFTGLEAGVYKVTVRDRVGCEVIQFIEVKKQSSTQEQNAENIVNQLFASPNPSTGLAVLTLKSTQKLPEEAWCDVLDKQGKLLYSVRMGRWDDELRGALSLEKQAPGLYVLRVRGIAGATTRIVKE